MFWRFQGYTNISGLDSVLEKPDCSLEEILDESDLISELKTMNTKLIEFLRDDARLQKMLHYVIAPKPAPLPPPKKGEDEAEEEARRQSEGDREQEEKARLKYAFVSCEVLSSDAFSIQEALMDNPHYLRTFWQFLDREPPLEPLQASYFTKVNETLLDKHTERMIPFIKSLDGIVAKALKHIDCPMVMDLLLKIISMEKTDGGAGIVDWLHSQNLIPMLLDCLSPSNPATTQTASGDFIKALITISANASQNEASCIGPNDLTRQLVSDTCINKLINDMLQGGNALTVGVGIIIEVIRKNNSDYDPDIGTGIDSIPSSRDPIYLGTLLRIFASHVPDFMNLILNQFDIVENEDGTKTKKIRELPVAFGGKIEPLGFDRFKTCELMAELLHCSNMGLLNEKGGERYVKERDRERDRLKAERQQDFLAVEAMANDPTAGSEEVVVEKAPLQVQNGGVEFSDDGMNEDEFEDVSVSGVLDEERKGEIAELGETQAVGDEDDDTTADDEDIFVDEPLSPPTSAVDAPTSEAIAPLDETPAEPVPASIPADEIPPLNVAPKNIMPLDQSALGISVPSIVTSAEAPEQTVADDIVFNPQGPPPPPPPKDEPVSEEISTPKSEEVPKKEQEADDVPRAPSPPPGGDDTEALRKDGRSLVADLKAASPSFGMSPDRMNADLPPLPAEAEKTPRSPLEPHEENLLDIGSSPDTTLAEGDISGPSLSSFGSSFTEYQTMIEPDLDGRPVVGDYLKMMFVEHRVVPTILDFFFRFPWNNFLHNVVYDVVQQVFNGPMERGYNRALAIDLFVTGRITERIVEGQRASDEYEAQRKMRLGYMGHLTLIAEEVVKFAERHQPEILGQKVLEKVAEPTWIEYVEETLAATRERDNAILGGVRPDMNLGPRMQAQAFNANAANGGSLLGGGLDSIDLQGSTNGGPGGSGGGSGGLLSGFGSSSDEEDDDMDHDDDDDEVARLGLTGSSDQFASYISQEITNVDKFGSSDEDDDDDDDMSFATAPHEPPPPPPLPLNIRRGEPVLENPFESAEDRYGDEIDSSDEDEDELVGSSGSLLRRTHEAAKRDLLEDEDDDDEDFVSEGVKALNIRSPPAVAELKEVASGEFYGPVKPRSDADISEKAELVEAEEKQEEQPEKQDQGEGESIVKAIEEKLVEGEPLGEEIREDVKAEVKESVEATEKAKQEQEQEQEKADKDKDKDKEEEEEEEEEEKTEGGAGGGGGGEKEAAAHVEGAS